MHQRSYLEPDRILKYLSIIYSLMVVNSVVYYYALYSYFGINVLSYVELGEMLFLFVPVFVEVVLAQVMQGSIMLIFAKHKINNDTSALVASSKNVKAFYLKVILILFGVAILICIGLVIVDLFHDMTRNRNFHIACIWAIVGILINAIVMPFSEVVAKMPLLSKFLTGISIACLAVFSIYISTVRQIETIENQVRDTEYRISFHNSDKEIFTNDYLTFMERFKNYTLLYNRANKEVLVLKNEDIKLVRIQAK